MENDTTKKIELDFIAVVGPTASGKSAAAWQLAKRLGGEIICCDSVQVYRGFDIGSAKPTQQERQEVSHHLFDCFDWFEDCDAAIYAQKARDAIAQIHSRGKIPIVTGGTGLYLRALTGERWNSELPKDSRLRASLSELPSIELYEMLKSKDPARANEVHMNDRFRVIRALEIVTLTGKPVQKVLENHSSLSSRVVIAMDPLRQKLHEQIKLRTARMLEDGLIAEVETLLAQGVDPNCKPMKSIGYAEVVALLNKTIPSNQLSERIEASTRQYAKRQCTWFKKIERQLTLLSVEGARDWVLDVENLWKTRLRKA